MRDEAIHRARVEECCTQTVKEMGLEWLDVTLKYSTKNDERMVCEATPDWEYRQTSLIWELVMVAALTDDELHAVMVHELAHSLIAPLWYSLPDDQPKYLEKLNEFATENVTQAILSALKVGWK